MSREDIDYELAILDLNDDIRIGILVVWLLGFGLAAATMIAWIVFSTSPDLRLFLGY